jgi:hypothetical protein
LAPEHNPLFAHLIQLAASAESDTSLHARGLATALLAVALRSRQSSSLLQQTLTPPLLFAIITQQIGLEKYLLYHFILLYSFLFHSFDV